MEYNDKYNKNLQETIDNVFNVDFMKNKSILVTGSTGLIGSAIIDTLIYKNCIDNSNIHIYAAGRSKDRIQQRFSQFLDKDFFTSVLYDANKELDFDFDVDYIIHGASNAHPLAYSEQPVETMISNFCGMNNLLKYAQEHNVLRTLYISSSEVYGEKTDSEYYKENDYGFVNILNPRACYPSSKRASETLCASYKKEYDLDVLVVRPGHIYGPTMTNSDSRASAQFARNVINGQDIIMKSAGLQLRSYCYVFDCVSAILAVLLNGTSGEAYNISNRNSVVTIRQLAESFANSCDRKIVFENPDDVEILGYNMMSCSALDASKLENLGWQGLYDIDEGVGRTIEILKENQ
ncbi:dTDP-glucose 4,6-dehydratase [Clostridium beijerinckii]|uniref:NAD-dependent epimerase/dehydratase family protein n=1 Tax=Clostridium beijerinckii TaxID=1520 RepID=A0AB74VIW5_CLOBE|nr:NAD-dependent epimerase/dehydratase family protein [Clostridium beijerinckii]NRZ25604.1 nucleoside-diphosphate-sugar epimerase [Clostridium beijerinckii]NYB98119.1 nucleoside-diphosphate-sugar epimerase [Clostridium beijerinckii]OOM23266.1 dTDP-glucose 4,6-dehydratase [Clostridium beijerinckii]QUN36356.1 NAD-dependent epimerase/dehydratase family protein [Clostridium beijerinckii]SQB12934.1 dTDP-glucose 4-6-dehydratase/UDP-glucuronic acid decarboxylase [Clostridium beijerinckii]